jgi:type IV pilus assembly protein PilP
MNQKLQNNNIIPVMLVLGAAVVALLGIQGCNKNEQQQNQAPVVKPVSETANQQVQAVQKPASSSHTLPAPPVNQFDFSTKKDPFKPYVIIQAPAATSGTPKSDLKSALPIHSFDVSQFKLIGIVTGGKENHAMVTDPNGKGYVLKAGMTIGKNDGRITAVTNSGVEILEQFKDDNGRVRKEHITITLPRKQ